MKKKLLFITMLCVSHIMCFAQVKMNSASNFGMGKDPNAKARLLLYNSNSSTDTIFGLHATMENTLNNSPGPNTGKSPVYGVYSINNNSSHSSLYGAYFKNTLLNTSQGGPGPVYGVYVDNKNTTYSGSTYGFYANNTGGNSSSGTFYGAYLNNDRSASSIPGSIHTVYGLYSTNSSSVNGTVYGAYLLSTSSNSSSSVYGLYSTVSGGNVNNRYAGYFTGGKVVMTNAGGTIGLEVSGQVWAEGAKLTSDERLKTDIKPLSVEKEKLYLLQGKSYKKRARPIASEEDSLAKKMEIIEMPEYGYLAQELEKIFPDLVEQDSAGYYGVNYIGLIPVIVEALKDQRSESEKQQIQIEKQQVQIDEQREQIKQLVKLINIQSIHEKAFEENGIESIALLLQNTPNPFNQTTEIGYYIPETVNSAHIYIYDINGFQQKNISISGRGKGATTLQASALQAGIYFYTLICDGKPVDTKQMILTK